MTPEQDDTIKNILDHLTDLRNYPDEALAPYEEFKVGGKTYYFTPGGSLYRKDRESEGVSSVFYSYLSDKLWYYKADDG